MSDAWLNAASVGLAPAHVLPVLKEHTVEVAASSLIASPRITICIVTYNHAKYLRECLDSMLAQSLIDETEIVVCDDASTDDTVAILRDYQARHPEHIRLLLAEKNMSGLGLATPGKLNSLRGLLAARGAYVAICEGDDFWIDEHKLQKQTELLGAKKRLVACHTWQRDIDAEGREKKAVKMGYCRKRVATVRDIFANRMRVKTRTVLYRNVFDQVSLPTWWLHARAGDVPLSMVFGKLGDFGFIDEPMAVYRHTGEGISSVGRDARAGRIAWEHAWVDIWERGSELHDHAYLPEVQATILHFVKRIAKHARPLCLPVWTTALGYPFRSRLPLTTRLRLTVKMLCVALCRG